MTSLSLEKYNLPGLMGIMKTGRAILLSIFILSFSQWGHPEGRADRTAFDQGANHLSIIEKAKAERSAGNFEQAAALLKEAQRLADSVNDRQAKPIGLMYLGLTSWDLGEIKESLRYFSEAAAIFHMRQEAASEDVCCKSMEIIRLYDLGKGNRSRNQNAKSIECFDKAINIGRQMGVENFELKCLRLQSLTYWEMGDVGRFFACNKRALDIARRLKHRREIGRCLNNIGVYYAHVGDYSNALRNYETALPLLTAENDLYTEASCINNIGVIYRNIGELNKALGEITEALKIDEKLGDLALVAEDQGNLGATYLHRGWINEDKHDITIALAELDKCMDLLQANPDARLELAVLNNMGFAHSLIGEYDCALEIFAKAQSKAKGNLTSEGYCHLLNNIAAAYYGKGKIGKAVGFYNRSVSLSSEGHHLEVLWEAYFGVGCCYEAEKDLRKALDYFNKSIDAMEQVRRRIVLDLFKISFVRSKLAVYQHALGILYSLYAASPSMARLEDIFRMIERVKGRAFLEGLIEANAGDSAGGDPVLSGRERELSREISILNKKAGEAGLSAVDRNERLRDLEKKEDEYMRLVSSLKTERRDLSKVTPLYDLSISEVQNSLIDPRTALLEYLISENRSYLLLITSRSARLYTLAGRRGIESSLRGYLKSLASPPSGPFNGLLAAERIGKELLFPLEGDFPPEIDRLIIIPDGILGYLPFETLRMNAGENAGYLLEKYRISYCPSSAALLLLRQEPTTDRRAKTLLAVGAPFYGRPEHSEHGREVNAREMVTESYLGQDITLASLPFSKEEVLKIAGLFPAHQADLFLGKQATETILKKLPLDGYRIIHFACHAFLDDKLPFRSALVLSREPDDEEDGCLQVREIYGLKMDADLVVLSACQTGNGTLEQAEGLVGLTRSFFHAGANAVLSTIWAINDRTTALLMERFYSCLAQGLDKSSALREAKLSLLRSSHSHPYYWGGFLLSGDPAPVHIDGREAQELH